MTELPDGAAWVEGGCVDCTLSNERSPSLCLQNTQTSTPHGQNEELQKEPRRLN